MHTYLTYLLSLLSLSSLSLSSISLFSLPSLSPPSLSPPFWLRVRSRGTYIHMAKSGRQGWLRKSLLQQELFPVAFGKDTAISRPWRRAGTAAQKAVSAPV